MALVTTAWMVGSFVDPEVAAEGAVARMGTGGGAKMVGGVAEHMVAGEVEQVAMHHPHIVDGIALDDAQRQMMAQGARLGPLVDPATGLAINPGQNTIFRVEFDDGTHAVHKPASGENHALHDGEYGPYWQNEVGAYHVDRALGFNQVPTTAAYQGEHGVGSVQAWAPGRAVPMSAIDQQRMATFDYIIGNGDRNGSNVLSWADGRPAAIDNGMAFPNGDGYVIRSDQVHAMVNQPLDHSVVTAARNVDQAALADQLHASGLHPDAVTGTMNRLNEVATEGRITGSAWTAQTNAVIMNSNFQILDLRPRH